MGANCPRWGSGVSTHNISSHLLVLRTSSCHPSLCVWTIRFLLVWGVVLWTCGAAYQEYFIKFTELYLTDADLSNTGLIWGENMKNQRDRDMEFWRVADPTWHVQQRCCFNWMLNPSCMLLFGLEVKATGDFFLSRLPMQLWSSVIFYMYSLISSWHSFVQHVVICLSSWLNFHWNLLQLFKLFIFNEGLTSNMGFRLLLRWSHKRSI